jgi:hypothetical protein
VFLFTLSFSAKSVAQSVSLNYTDELLNEVLLDLNQRYGVQISIKASLSNSCPVTIQQRFNSIDLAIQALAASCDLEYKKVGEVYVFRSREPADLSAQSTAQKRKAQAEFLYQGTIVEKSTNEPLPFSLIQIQGRGIVADEQGRFSFRSGQRQQQALFQYLGYEQLDTLINHSNNLTITMRSTLVELGEVEVIASAGRTPLTNVGEKAGHIRFNDISSNLIPGLSNNLIFNNLRLYPGVMAAGESIADFVIWGSYAGQTHVVYDGISLFNSWGINDDMGRINPYMIKNVEVYKGGYNVPYGDRVGGVVLMEGTAGDLSQVNASLSLTNQLANAYLNIPLLKNKATIQLAGRKTFFEAFDLSSGFGESDDVIVPQYDYADFNVKLTAAFSNADRLELSSIFSEDSYNGNLSSGGRGTAIEDVSLNSVQTGNSVTYVHSWARGGISRLLLSQSNYEPDFAANYFLQFDPRPIGDTLRQYNWKNEIQEYKLQINHTFAANTTHQLQLSGGLIGNRTALTSNTDRVLLEDTEADALRVSAFAHDDLQWSEKFSMQLGLKADLLTHDARVFWQPRINARFDLNDQWNLHAGWGLYNQFVSKNTIVDELGNRSDVWQVADGRTAPVLSANHSVIGLRYLDGSFELGLEAFSKHSEGFGRFFVNRDGNTAFVQGESRARGFELLAKKKVRTHQFWLAYTLSKVEERFSNRFNFSGFQLAPQSQQHELKTVAVFNFSPLQVSFTNVYGSGFPNGIFRRDREDLTTYWRTDIAVQYAFSLGNTSIETGLSVLNLFDRQNVRLNQSLSVPSGGRINTVGIPFTPTLYVNFGF